MLVLLSRGGNRCLQMCGFFCVLANFFVIFFISWRVFWGVVGVVGAIVGVLGRFLRSILGGS